MFIKECIEDIKSGKSVTVRSEEEVKEIKRQLSDEGININYTTVVEYNVTKYLLCRNYNKENFKRVGELIWGK